ncbi:ABC transporter substrate-binding protein [Bacillus sp. KH172YL63]|uniref:ABC transporter substrate-binding protein n=1 Tax=Bacillus sp. KH172YL63 TaxID=2709784 RepID=UPI0013E4D78A|nr:ABC transporter substrate-binding protein [Bacillus sp. KH172YL63]BCB02537.1 ABC transporter substrate-binding protein [Bacillus sp. KH172YL63]
MENKLLTLWRYYPSGNIRVEEISETLQLSLKQTTRYLKKWNEEGWMVFTPGRGRGNVSKLSWKKDVEEAFEEVAMKEIEQKSVAESSKYLMYEWSTDTKLRLMNQFHTKLGFIRESADKLIVPKRHPFFSIHPLKAADVLSAHLVANVFNRLVSITENGDILPELAHSWDVSPEKARLYLRKDITFHDGSSLTAKDVVDCLDRVRHDPHYKGLWTPVEKIEVKAPHVIDLHHPSGCSYVLPMLSMMYASIYKENKGRVLGTGSFSIEENKDEKTTLAAFKNHFRERPLLDAVEFVQVPHDFKGMYQSHHEQHDGDSVEVESDSGFGIVVMDPTRDSDIRRKEVRDFLHWIIAKYRHSISDYEPRAATNDKSTLAGQDQHMHIREARRPSFTAPIVIRGAKHTARTTQWLVDVFEKENIPVDLQWFSFKDTLIKHPKTLEVDLFIHGEIFESSQNFSFYHFMMNGFSPLHHIVEKSEKLKGALAAYPHTPFAQWTELNMKVERMLMEESIMIPLYYEKRFIPFTTDIMNIEIKHFGYVDFSKLWVRPVV